jgi:hypothetical protein
MQVREKLEIDMMALFLSQSIADVTKATSHLRVPVRERPNPPDLTFIVWATVILTGLAIISVALGIGPVDPAIFASP